MAYITGRTLTVLLVFVSLIIEKHCDSDVNFALSDVLTDIHENTQKYKDIEPEKTIRKIEKLERENETFIDDDDAELKVTTEEDRTTTDVPEDIKDLNDFKNDDFSRHGDKDERIDEIAAPTVGDVTEYVDSTLSSVDNDVYKQRDMREDIYITANHSSDEKIELTTQSTTRPMDEIEDFVPRIAELGEDDTPGQRIPKIDNSEPKPQIDKRNFEPKPRPPPAVTKSSTLKGWLEDSWVRPPAGILVPLRPMALNRALAVWNDLTVDGLNVSDIVIVGYDSNGVNWRSRHSLQPSNNGGGDRAVSEALSKLLLKYQGVNTDASSDGTMRALASAAKLVPYDSALFVVTDKGVGDPQRLPLALRALVEKRLKVYTIWTDPSHPSPNSEAELQELKNVSRHTEGDVLPYSLQVMDMDSSSNLASEADLQEWDPMDSIVQNRRGRLNSQIEAEKFETLLVRRGGGEALSLGVPVENGVSALRVYIEGAVEHAVLYPPNDAPQIDLYNITSVASFSPTSRTEGLNPRDVLLIFPGASLKPDMLSVIPANPPNSDAGLVGNWHLSVRCDTCDYRMCVGARAQLKFNVEEDKPDKLKFRITGPVSSVRESLLIDEYGTELAKLSYSYPPMTRNPEDAVENPIADLAADVETPAVKGSRVYAKIVGRDVKGEPFIRLAGPLLHQSEVRMGRAAVMTYPDSRNDLEVVEEANFRAYQNRLQFNDSGATPYNRIVSQVVNQRGVLLTAVQIGLSTKLYGSPGDNLQLHFEVTNYREQAMRFNFIATAELKSLTGISHSSTTINAGQTLNVIVSATIGNSVQAGARDLITFTVYDSRNVEQVSISAYLYVLARGETPYDVWSPEVRHNFQGSCLGRMGDDCAQHVWSATVFARDNVGGLLRLSSSPVGIMYDSNFISGTRGEVQATYRATCCAPRVMVTAVDAFGNTNSYPVDISNYITGAGIAAIVLGVFLAIALICLIIFLIYWCVRRRKESRELPYSTSSRNIS